MKPLAIMPCFNEADILPAVLTHLNRQGVECLVLDNWSTDGSDGLALRYGARMIRWPADGPSNYYEWSAILEKIEELAAEHPGRWIILHDADEVRNAPRQHHGYSLAQALMRVSGEGYNAAAFSVKTFAPVDNGFAGDLRHFRYYIPRHIDGKTPHIKAWVQGSERVDIHTRGGHQAVFEGRRVYPLKFLSNHYPIRSQQHGEQKVLRERLTRYLAEERKRGWHIQYRDYSAAGNAACFLKDPATLCLDYPPITIVTLTGFPEIFERFAESVEKWEPEARRIVVTSRGVKINRLGWEVIEGPAERFNFGHNANLGISAAGGDVLLVNDDVVFESPVLRGLREVMGHEERIALVSPQVNGGIGLKMARHTSRISDLYELSREPVPYVCVLLNSEFMQAEGLLNESFEGYAGEDEEHNLRALRAGWKLAVTPRVTVRHGFGEHGYSSSFFRVMSAEERDATMEVNRGRARELAWGN